MNSNKLVPWALRSVLGCALALGASVQAATVVGSFTGGDPGEGLDLQGNFTYAVNIGTAGPAGKAGDATFTGDTVSGVTVTAQNEIAGWLAANYGTTEADLTLATVMRSMRWSAAPETPGVRVRVEPGIEYKLQLLFGEQCCPGRGFNVVINGEVVVPDLMPAWIQMGDGEFNTEKVRVGAVVTHTFTASGDFLEIVLDGPGAESFEITDRNAILNGFTLERLSATSDSDGDGLPDDWEIKYFGHLNYGPTDDPDGDGLTNQEEFALGTDPSNRDSDGDTLSDGDEVKIYKTDPLNRDTDGDGLTDGYEVNVSKTDPTKTDTDGDSFSDKYELIVGTDPTNANNKPLLTTFNRFTGGDAGEGLDLDGNFIYALNAGGGDEAWGATVRDVTFDTIFEDDVLGATLLAGNTAGNWYNVNYGDTENDAALKLVTQSIRWSSAGSATQPDIILSLDNLEKDSYYKLQLLFGEAGSDRGFDIFINETRVADDFNPGVLQGGLNGNSGVVLTHQYFSRSTTQVVIRVDGRGAPFPDQNAIINAVTLEKIAGNVDTDNDGLHDDWERLYFGNLNQGATDDPDGDGLTNAQEFALGTHPLLADTDNDGLSDAQEVALGTNPLSRDTDGDGLSDADEVNIYKTDPLKWDTDGDGLSDGQEVLVYGTDPLKADTDGDGLSDGDEIRLGLDPLVAVRRTDFSKIIVSTFTGGDTGEGLDLQGNFLYAFSVGPGEAPGKAGDANFTTDSAPGIQVTAQNQIGSWHQPDYGDSANDEVIKAVMRSIRWSASPARPKVELSGLIPGSTYKLQLLFVEQCCPGRGFHVIADGTVLAENFMPAAVHGGNGNSYEAAVISTELVTYSDKMVILLDGAAATDPDINDRNPILSGVTLEILQQAAPPLRIGSIIKDAAGVRITLQSVAGTTYILEFKENLNDPAWSTVTQLTASGNSTILTDTIPAHLNSRGFWRVRTP